MVNHQYVEQHNYREFLFNSSPITAIAIVSTERVTLIYYQIFGFSWPCNKGIFVIFVYALIFFSVSLTEKQKEEKQLLKIMKFTVMIAA